MKWLIRVDNNMNSFQIYINGLNTPPNLLENYLHVVILKWIIFLCGNATYLSNPSSNADFINLPGSPNRTIQEERTEETTLRQMPNYGKEFGFF